MRRSSPQRQPNVQAYVAFTTSRFKAAGLFVAGILLSGTSIAGVLGYGPAAHVTPIREALVWIGAALFPCATVLVLWQMIKPPALVLTPLGIAWKGQKHPWSALRGYGSYRYRRHRSLFFYFNPTSSGATIRPFSIQPRLMSADFDTILSTVLDYAHEMRGDRIPDLGVRNI